MPNRRVPDRLRSLHGLEEGPRRPPFDDSPPEAPRGMSRAARRLWDYYAPLMVHVTKLDRDTLADYCETEARLRELRAELREAAPADRWRKDRDIRQYLVIAKQYALVLGLAPKAREGLTMPEAPPETDADIDWSVL